MTIGERPRTTLEQNIDLKSPVSHAHETYTGFVHSSGFDRNDVRFQFDQFSWNIHQLMFTLGQFVRRRFVGRLIWRTRLVLFPDFLSQFSHQGNHMRFSGEDVMIGTVLIQIVVFIE